MNIANRESFNHSPRSSSVPAALPLPHISAEVPSISVVFSAACATPKAELNSPAIVFLLADLPMVL